MTEEKTIAPEVTEEVVVDTTQTSESTDKPAKKVIKLNKPAGEKKSAPRRGGKGRKGGRGKKEPKEFMEEVLDIARVTRVVKGGRRMRFLATVAIGDKKGRVGVGTGKSVEVSVAIRKAVESAKKNIINVEIVNGTVPFEKKIKHKGARMMMMPAPQGTGVIAGGAFRKVVTLSGVTDIYAKSVGTTSPLVCAQASIKMLSSFTRRRKIEEEPSKK